MYQNTLTSGKVVFYDCRTYYKAVRGEGRRIVEGMCCGILLVIHEVKYSVWISVFL
jgi:hypothetical protein